MLRATGIVKRVESKTWEIEGRKGITHTVRLLVGDADFSDVKIGVDEFGVTTVPLPAKDQAVDYGVVPTVSYGKVAVTVRGTWADLVGESEAPKAVRSAG